VAEAFPSASGELTEAGNCFAAGVYTACVFHLMRAVEHLLRSFANGVGVTQTLEIPLEYQVWNTLIEGSESKIKKVGERWRNKPAIELARGTLRSSVADFYFFKDEIRNHVAHTRSGLVSEVYALDVMKQVRRCFDKLSPYLKEDQHDSILVESVWL
jgi:hypothetical protein